MLLAREPDAGWASLAAELRLPAHLVCMSYREGESFHQLRARIGLPAPNPGLSDWLCGTMDGARVIVAHYVTKGSIADFGHNTTSQGGAYRTAVLVELDPPLFMGARIGAERFFGGADLQLGVPAIDGSLKIHAHDPVKLRALLTPTSASDSVFLEQLAGAVRDGAFITDSMVGFHLREKVPSAATVGRCLHTAGWLRREILARLARVPTAPHEQGLAAEWGHVASARRLQFDAARQRIEGLVDGVAVSVAAVPSDVTQLTEVSARWPRCIGVQLAVAKFAQQQTDPALQAGPHATLLQLFTNLVGQDIRVGDEPFDDAYQVMGFPEQAVRNVFTSPHLRAAMVQIAKVADEVSMTDQAITWFVKASARGADLGGHLDMAAYTAKALFPSVEAAHPFR